MPHRQKERALWVAVSWVLTCVLASLGSIYALGGLTATAADRPYIVLNAMPGGMHTHGLLMLLHAAGLAFGLQAPAYGQPVLDRWVRRVLISVCGYSAWIVFAFVAAWVLTGVPTPGGIVWWSASCALSAILCSRPPSPPLNARGVTDARG